MAEQLRFEEFAHASQQRLFRTAYLLCGDRETAQDLVQSTLLKLFSSWRRAAVADNVDAYARKVLLRTYVDQSRRRRRERALHELRDALPPADQPDLRVTVLEALAELPPKARAVVVLRYWEDQSIEATAELLRCSTGNVKSQSARGLAKLRALLESSDV